MSELVERYTIKPIPDQERHGTGRSLFPFWFTANSSAFTVVLGAVGIELGLGVIPTLIAIVAGGAVGGVFMAYHSAQGPKLGLPRAGSTTSPRNAGPGARLFRARPARPSPTKWQSSLTAHLRT